MAYFQPQKMSDMKSQSLILKLKKFIPVFNIVKQSKIKNIKTRSKLSLERKITSSFNHHARAPELDIDNENQDATQKNASPECEFYEFSKNSASNHEKQFFTFNLFAKKMEKIKNKKREIFICSIFMAQFLVATFAFLSFNSWLEQSASNKHSAIIHNQKQLLSSLLYFENKIQRLHSKALETMYNNSLPTLFNEQQQIQNEFLKWKLSASHLFNTSAPFNSYMTPHVFTNDSATNTDKNNGTLSAINNWLTKRFSSLNSTIDNHLIDTSALNILIKNNNDKISHDIASIEQALLSLETASTSDALAPSTLARYAILENSATRAAEQLLGILKNTPSNAYTPFRVNPTEHTSTPYRIEGTTLSTEIAIIEALHNLQNTHHNLHTKILINLFRERHSDNKAPPLFLPNVGQPLPALGGKNSPSPIPSALERRQIEEKLSLQESHSAPLSAQQQYEILQQHLLLNQQYQQTKLLLNSSKITPVTFNIDEIAKIGPFFSLQKTLDDLLTLDSANERLKFIQQFNPEILKFYKEINSQKEALLLQPNTQASALPFLFNLILSLSTFLFITIFMLKNWIKQNTENILIQKMIFAFYKKIHPYFSANIGSTILFHKNKQTPSCTQKDSSFFKNLKSTQSPILATPLHTQIRIDDGATSNGTTSSVNEKNEKKNEKSRHFDNVVPQTQQVASMPIHEQLFALDALICLSLQEKSRLFESWEQDLSTFNPNTIPKDNSFDLIDKAAKSITQPVAKLSHNAYAKLHEQTIYVQNQLPKLLQQKETLIPQIGNSMLLLQNVQTASQQLFDQFEHKLQSISKWQHSIKEQTEKTLPITKILLTHNSLFLQESAKLAHLSNKIHQISTLLFSEMVTKAEQLNPNGSHNTQNGSATTHQNSRRTLLIHLQSFVNTLSEIVGKQSAQCLQQQEQLRSLLTISQNIHHVSSVGTALSAYSTQLQKKFVEQQTLCTTINNSMQQFYETFAQQNTQTQDLLTSLSNSLETYTLTGISENCALYDSEIQNKSFQDEPNVFSSIIEQSSDIDEQPSSLTDLTFTPNPTIADKTSSTSNPNNISFFSEPLRDNNTLIDNSTQLSDFQETVFDETTSTANHAQTI